MSNHGSNDMPGANAMGYTLAFVKQLWGSMKIPGMAMPSLSPEDIDKQIADLKAVESWLQVNMNMLRGSIQALETIKLLLDLGDSLAGRILAIDTTEMTFRTFNLRKDPNNLVTYENRDRIQVRDLDGACAPWMH
jgi:hypothetical protein